MANILLTQQCVRSCPYCFAKKHMADSEKSATLSWEDLIHIADLFDDTPEKHLSLLGGEPTLHPDFVDYFVYLIGRGYHVSVFTCGILSEKRLDELVAALSTVNPGKYSFVCNLNHPSMSTEAETERIDAFLTKLGKQTALSFNVFTMDFTMDYLFDYIQRYDLRRNLRIGLAHPIPGETNACISPGQFGPMIERLASYIPKCISSGVVAGLDCGFPLCKFTDEQIGKFYKLEHGSQNRSLKFVCNPALDIGPDMKVWSCFPLSRFNKRSLYEFNSVDEVMEYFITFHKETRAKDAGAFAECASCAYRAAERCAGGCLAQSLNHLGMTEVVFGRDA